MEENKDFYIGEDGLEYCSKCHTPPEKELPSPFGDKRPFKVHFMCECQRKAYEVEQEERAKREFGEMVSRNRIKKPYGFVFIPSGCMIGHLLMMMERILPLTR